MRDSNPRHRACKAKPEHHSLGDENPMFSPGIWAFYALFGVLARANKVLPKTAKKRSTEGVK
jgi:hypothetical protein